MCDKPILVNTSTYTNRSKIFFNLQEQLTLIQGGLLLFFFSNRHSLDAYVRKQVFEMRLNMTESRNKMPLSADQGDKGE